MPTFETPEPVVMTLELTVADVRIVAGDRTDTTVEVRPTNSARKGDVAAAEQTRVDYADGRLAVRMPKGMRRLAPLGRRESIDVEIGVPAGSELRGDAAVAALHSTGRLGECRFKISSGSIHLADTGPVQLKTAAGDIGVRMIDGDAEVITSSGAIHVDRVDGSAVVKNSNGETRIGDVGGDVKVHAANGSITIGRAGGGVVAKTANGDVRVGEVVHGAVQVNTARGRVEIGVADGVAAWLDLKTSFGKVRSDLDASGQPAPGEDVVEVTARTAAGDITITRRHPDGARATR
jgi:hypothetical protein